MISRSETSDLLLLLERKQMHKDFSKHYLVLQDIWLLKFILNKDIMVLKLISLLLELFFSLCLLDIHHLDKLLQKILITKP